MTPRGVYKREATMFWAILRPCLVELGFEVESGKKAAQKIQRPALFGEMGEPGHKYEIDARFAVIAMPLIYKHKQKKGETVTVEVPSYLSGRKLLEAVYASQRLRLPFEGLLLIGY